jgi:hypothetical protein
MNRWDETWHRLREWTSGQGPSERLAAQVLLAEGFESLDPSHPLGGKDAGKDALVRKDGTPWIMAVYFPRGQQSFAAIRKKLVDDGKGAAANEADGIVFVTNQELTLSERKTLSEAVNTPLEIYHLERVTAILDQPLMYGVRAQFLNIAGPSESTVDALARGQVRLEGLQTGGDSYCYAMLYDFDLPAAVAQQFVLIRQGEFPLYDVRFRVRDVDAETDLVEREWGELNSPAAYQLLRWPLQESVYYRIFFSARNGAWHQDLQLRKSINARCWLAATRVLGANGRDVRLEHRDHGFIEEFGEPLWRP